MKDVWYGFKIGLGFIGAWAVAQLFWGVVGFGLFLLFGR